MMAFSGMNGRQIPTFDETDMDSDIPDEDMGGSVTGQLHAQRLNMADAEDLRVKKQPISSPASGAPELSQYTNQLLSETTNATSHMSIAELEAQFDLLHGSGYTQRQDDGQIDAAALALDSATARVRK